MQSPDFDRIISSMSLEQKIGQMFMGNICGGESLDIAKRNFEQFHFGGLQFSGVFERFVRGGDYRPCGVCKNYPLEEVAGFLADIKKASLDILGTPVIMGGDQEGCISSSIFRRRNVTLTPSPMGIGACGSPEYAYKSASVSAREIKALGLDMLYGPCLDVNTNPANPEIGARSFSDAPEIAAAMGEQIIRAYAENNIISNAKHFPGRGHGQANAHHQLESIDLDRKRLHEVELLPFKRAIAAGVDSVMVGHTRYPALDDSGLPSSLSPAIIQGLLREELGFEGVIIPDTLTMFAISKNYEVPDACVKCLVAGADMIFMKVQNLYQPVIDAIKQAVREGKLSEERMDRSIRRILALKAKRGLFDARKTSPEKVTDTVGCAKHVEVMTEISRRSTVLVKNEAGILPLPKEKSILAVIPRDMNVVLSNDKNLSHDMLPRAAGKYFPEIETIITDEMPTPYQAYETVGRAKNCDVILFGIYSTGFSQEQQDLLCSLAELGKDIVVVITGSPYAVLKLPKEVKAIICTFGITMTGMAVVAGMLAGEVKPGGTMPVKLSDEMPRGFSVKI
jgi:beta-N-acetylhexosaminidase